VVLLVLAAAGGLVAGRARRPIGGHGAVPHLRQMRLLVAGCALALVAAMVHGDVSVLADALAIASIAVFCGVNRNITGIAVIGAGLVLNLAAVVLDNGMPVRPKALVAADVVDADEVAHHHIRDPRHLETDNDRFGWLGAVVPVPGLRQVISFGDLIVLVGLVDACRDLGRRRSRLPDVEGTDDIELWPVPDSGPAAPAPEAPEAAEAPAPAGATSADPAAGADGGPAQPGGAASATTSASVDQDWGTAPRPAPESGSQCSAKPLPATAFDSEFWKDAAVGPSPAHLAARHDR
jgi:hypothetical protein